MITYVRVRKPDGQIVETSLTNTQDFAPEILSSAPMYSDFREKHVSVAGLQVGDLLEYASVLRDTKPIIPGQFWMVLDFPRNMVVNSEELDVDVPKIGRYQTEEPETESTRRRKRPTAEFIPGTLRMRCRMRWTKTRIMRMNPIRNPMSSSQPSPTGTRLRDGTQSLPRAKLLRMTQSARKPLNLLPALRHRMKRCSASTVMSR